jgi:uncharacterized membrane protein
MKFTVSTILTALLGFAVGLFFPWWFIAVASFIVAVFIHQRPLPAYAAGFLGISLSWGIHAAFIDAQNHSILSAKVAQILPVGSSLNLILLTAFIGGLVSGFAALTGSYTRKYVTRRNRKDDDN